MRRVRRPDPKCGITATPYAAGGPTFRKRLDLLYEKAHGT